MALSVAPLLLHSDSIPEGARLALRDAFARPEDERPALLANVARILYREADLECSDALELLGLSVDTDLPCGCL
ncbi:MAG: hypothetical protein ABI678_26275 [Kofleriaceae bacterium]